MIKIELQENELYNIWFMKKGITESTQKIYKGLIKLFLNKIGLTLSEFYNECLKEKNLEKNPIGLKILSIFQEFKQNYSSNYISTIKATMMSFCTTYNIIFPKFHLTVTGKPENYRRNIRNREIKELMKYGNIRNKAIISLATTSGMRSIEIRLLTHQQIVQSINDELSTNYNTIQDVIQDKQTILTETDCFPISVLSHKTHKMYTTFLATETLELILEYYKTLSDTEINETKYLFRKVNNKPLQTGTQRSMQYMLAKQINFDNNRVKYGYSLFAPHQLRRYFYTTVLNHVGVIYADLWTGHKLPQVRSAYTRVDETMQEKYRECLPYLSLKDNKLSNSELNEYKLLKEKEEMIEKSYDLLERMDMLEKL
ncbi:tyrosine-type recombinase/integrase [Methanosphaera sp.]|uniref:tyrosine-type recombinase/integrase n=1 Tax=Methanosphaera sp. TaxID=2666342 RepID=UPI003D92183E